jgi:hypothetical protein
VYSFGRSHFGLRKPNPAPPTPPPIHSNIDFSRYPAKVRKIDFLAFPGKVRNYVRGVAQKSGMCARVAGGNLDISAFPFCRRRRRKVYDFTPSSVNFYLFRCPRTRLGSLRSPRLVRGGAQGWSRAGVVARRGGRAQGWSRAGVVARRGVVAIFFGGVARPGGRSARNLGLGAEIPVSVPIWTSYGCCLDYPKPLPLFWKKKR